MVRQPTLAEALKQLEPPLDALVREAVLREVVAVCDLSASSPPAESWRDR
jgi:hypothetical protein